LGRRVRTAAAAATGEEEFLAQLRTQRVLVRPWFATGDFTTVVGMSVTLPTGSSGANLDWHGGAAPQTGPSVTTGIPPMIDPKRPIRPMIGW